MKTRHKIRVCQSDQLREGSYLKIPVLYKGEASSVIVFRYHEKCLAYRNLCVHMPRMLDGERDTIFDKSRQYLRCSMHGIIYDPVTGESVSTICNGERLTPIKIQQNEDGIWLVDKRLKPRGKVD